MWRKITAYVLLERMGQKKKAKISSRQKVLFCHEKYQWRTCKAVSRWHFSCVSCSVVVIEIGLGLKPGLKTTFWRCQSHLGHRGLWILSQDHIIRHFITKLTVHCNLFVNIITVTGYKASCFKFNQYCGSLPNWNILLLFVFCFVFFFTSVTSPHQKQ